jgi:hypothetical protein
MISPMRKFFSLGLAMIGAAGAIGGCIGAPFSDADALSLLQEGGVGLETPDADDAGEADALSDSFTLSDAFLPETGGHDASEDGAIVLDGSTNQPESDAQLQDASGSTCAPAYKSDDCGSYTVGEIVSLGQHDWKCATSTCANCASYPACAPSGMGCPWGSVWADEGPCEANNTR